MTLPARSRRLPSNHRLVYDVVRAQRAGTHLAASEVLANARALKPGLGHSTVYRALDRLCERGLILAVHVPGMNAALFEPARANHAHFVCGVCGVLDDLDCDLPVAEIHAAVETRGGKVNDVTLTVQGHCAKCRANAPSRHQHDT